MYIEKHKRVNIVRMTEKEYKRIRSFIVFLSMVIVTLATAMVVQSIHINSDTDVVEEVPEVTVINAKASVIRLSEPLNADETMEFLASLHENGDIDLSTLIIEDKSEETPEEVPEEPKTTEEVVEEVEEEKDEGLVTNEKIVYAAPKEKEPNPEVKQEESPETTEEKVLEEAVTKEITYASNNKKSYTVNSYIKDPSGLTADDINRMLDGTGLAGLGQAIYEAERDHHVNAYFTMGVASVESGVGTSTLAKERNNLFGLSGMSFSTKTECIQYFGKLLENYKSDDQMTPAGINPRYCPPNNPKWSQDVVWFMNKYAKMY